MPRVLTFDFLMLPIIALALGLLLALSGGPAAASTQVLGGGLAQRCSVLALDGMADRASIQTCTLALETEPLRRLDRARTHVNRGIIHLRRKTLSAAADDFDAAQAMEPTIAEIYVNRGAVLIASGRYGEGLVQIDRGLALGAEEPQKAYYNRALAHEGLNNLKAAYYDYRRAAELDPEWDAPRRELARFTLSRPGAQPGG